MTEEKKIEKESAEEKKEQAPVAKKIPLKKYSPLLVLIAFIGVFSIYYTICDSKCNTCPCTSYEKDTEQTADNYSLALQKTENWLNPLFEEKKSKLQELPEEFKELKDLLEKLYYRIDSYLNSPKANKLENLQEIKKIIEKNINKETKEWVDSHLQIKNINLESAEEELKKHSNDVCTYSCIVYKKAIPMLEEFFQEKK